MKKYIIFYLTIFFTTPVFSQYNGGQGDGFEKMVITTYVNGAHISSLYNGGSADGFANKIIEAYINGGALDGLYTGGSADGFAKKIIETYVNGVSLEGLFSGGNGDGFAIFTNGGFLIPLPIQLLSFDATAKETYVLVKWVTESEKNNSFFTIERSQNGVLFNNLMIMPSQGNSQTVQIYTQNDNDPLMGRSFYRLKWTDVDGRSKYSEIRSVFFKQDIKKDFLLFPNPSDGNIINVQLDGITNSENISISIFDMQGKAIYQSLKPAFNSNQFSINLSQKLPNGSYVVRVIRNGETSSKVLIVQ